MGAGSAFEVKERELLPSEREKERELRELLLSEREGARAECRAGSAGTPELCFP